MKEQVEGVMDKIWIRVCTKVRTHVGNCVDTELNVNLSSKIQFKIFRVCDDLKHQIVIRLES